MPIVSREPPFESDPPSVTRASSGLIFELLGADRFPSNIPLFSIYNSQQFFYIVNKKMQKSLKTVSFQNIIEDCLIS